MLIHSTFHNCLRATVAFEATVFFDATNFEAGERSNGSDANFMTIK